MKTTTRYHLPYYLLPLKANEWFSRQPDAHIIAGTPEAESTPLWITTWDSETQQQYQEFMNDLVAETVNHQPRGIIGIPKQYGANHAQF
jgi:hypothetical protein